MINPTSSSDPLHFPVMLDEVIKICSPEKGGIYIDCTFGGGGYSKRLLNLFLIIACLAIIDKDITARLSKPNLLSLVKPFLYLK